jgi:hypothetical protein
MQDLMEGEYSQNSESNNLFLSCDKDENGTKDMAFWELRWSSLIPCTRWLEFCMETPVDLIIRGKN